jgi:hypothetical protein
MKNINNIARLTGFGYLIIFITGFFANFYVLEGLVVPGSASETAEHIINESALYSMGLAAFSLMVLVDIILAFPLYHLFKTVNEYVAKTSSALRLVNGAIFGIALISLFEIAMLSGNGIAELETGVLPLLEKFDDIWNIGLVFFGIHLLLLGWLIFKSFHIPGIIGILLQIAGIGYLVDSLAKLYLTNYDQYQVIFEMIVIVPGVIGEFSLTLWLLIKGMNYKRNQKGNTQTTS